jgi:ABC-type multidrug transport system ATPase subunit
VQEIGAFLPAVSIIFLSIPGKKEILHGISGKFPGGQIIAIMGPSGAGKSTLLDVLSGYKENNVQGAVLLNGRIRNINEFRKMSCYITQDDRIQPLLTVLENMRISADFKLGRSVSQHEKETRVSYTLKSFLLIFLIKFLRSLLD